MESKLAYNSSNKKKGAKKKQKNKSPLGIDFRHLGLIGSLKGNAFNIKTTHVDLVHLHLMD